MNISYIRIDKDIKDKIEELLLDKGYKYLSMIFYNKIVYTYLYQSKKVEDCNNLYVRKSIKSLSEFIFGKDEITYKCIREMERVGLIERGESYKKEEYSKGFKPRLLPIGKFITVKAVDYLSNHQITNLRKRVEKQRSKDLEWHLDNLIKNVELDLDMLKMLIYVNYGVMLQPYKDKEELISQIQDIEVDIEHIKKTLKNIGLKRITEKRLASEVRARAFLKTKILELLEIEFTEIRKGEKGGRHFHALSNAPRELKACLISKNPKKPYLMQVDIKNSQPFFLLCLLNKHKLEIEENLKLSIIGGTFYEDIGECWGISRFLVTDNHEVRGLIKSKVYSNILFADNRIRTESENFAKVKEKYPLFCESILKLASDTTLASLLQSLEAKEVLPLVKKYKGIGIHDSVITIAVNEFEIVEKIKAEIVEKFKKKYGIVPTVSVEKISERTDKILQLFKITTM